MIYFCFLIIDSNMSKINTISVGCRGRDLLAKKKMVCSYSRSLPHLSLSNFFVENFGDVVVSSNGNWLVNWKMLDLFRRNTFKDFDIVTGNFFINYFKVIVSNHNVDLDYSILSYFFMDCERPLLFNDENIHFLLIIMTICKLSYHLMSASLFRLPTSHFHWNTSLSYVATLHSRWHFYRNNSSNGALPSPNYTFTFPITQTFFVHYIFSLPEYRSFWMN